jgi:hypothetical protein
MLEIVVSASTQQDVIDTVLGQFSSSTTKSSRNLGKEFFFFLSAPYLVRLAPFSW